VRQVVLAEFELANFTSAFRQRFAALFGRKIARQRAEQYLGGLLAGRASRRNVTSLAQTIDGATARSLGWLLNKSPWATRPVVEAVQTYVAEEIGDERGIFALSLASFVKRGDNAVGVARQYVAQLGRTQNCQIGVFLAYGANDRSALVDAALYLPRSWTDDPARRQRAGVPDSIGYASRTELAVELLERTRAAGKLKGQWVTVHHGEGFEPDLRERLEAAGWWYLLPVSPDTTVYTGPEDSAVTRVADLLADAGGAVCARRVWEQVDGARGPAAWLVLSPHQTTGAVKACISNAPETVPLETLERILAAHWPTAMCESQREGTSLDVYRVRGWDGWHRHVALAVVASAFRACLPIEPAEAPAAPACALTPVPDEVDATPLTEPALERARADALDDAVAEAADDGMLEPLSSEIEDSVSIESVPMTYRLVVQIENTDWRAVRAFQTLLVAEDAGDVLSCSPSRAQIERQEVSERMEVLVRSERTTAEILTALEEVPEIHVLELAAQAEADESAAASDAAPVAEAPAPADLFLGDHFASDDAMEGDSSDLLAALEAELSERSIAREAGLSSPVEAHVEAVAARMDTAQQAIKAEAARELVSAASNGVHPVAANAATNGGAADASIIKGSVLAPIEPPVAPPDESPARVTSTTPLAPVTPVAPERPAQAAEAKEPVRLAEEQVIVLDVADESYGMPVQRVREIIRVPPITRVPNGPAFLEGVINLRGQVIPVLDLRKHLGVATTEHTRRSRVVVGELGEYTVGMVVDAVSQVVMVSSSQIEPPPALVANGENGQVRGVARLGDRLVLLLDPDRVLPTR